MYSMFHKSYSVNDQVNQQESAGPFVGVSSFEIISCPTNSYSFFFSSGNFFPNFLKSCKKSQHFFPFENENGLLTVYCFIRSKN